MATNGADVIICPYCKHWHGNIDDYLEVGDMGGDFDMECENCEEEFHVDFYSIFNFEATKKEEE